MEDVIIKEIRGEIDQSIIDLALYCTSHTKFASIKIHIDPKEFSKTVQKYANDEDCLFLIAYVKGKAVGTVMGRITNFIFTHDKIASETFFGVHELFRFQGISKMLIKEFQKWARQKGCKMITFGVNEFASDFANSANERLAKEGFCLFMKEYYKEL